MASIACIATRWIICGTLTCALTAQRVMHHHAQEPLANRKQAYITTGDYLDTYSHIVATETYLVLRKLCIVLYQQTNYLHFGTSGQIFTKQSQAALRKPRLALSHTQRRTKRMLTTSSRHFTGILHGGSTEIIGNTCCHDMGFPSPPSPTKRKIVGKPALPTTIPLGSAKWLYSLRLTPCGTWQGENENLSHPPF